jgi:hypothetical protein
MSRYHKPAAPAWRWWLVATLVCVAAAAAGFGVGFLIGR